MDLHLLVSGKVNLDEEVKIDLTYCHKNPYIYINPFVIIQKNTGKKI